MDDWTPHDLLLALAGRVDDDLLGWARELVAVGEDARAVELLTATLVAERAILPGPVRAALVDAGRTARTDLDAAIALPPAGPDTDDPHRFGPPHEPRVEEAVRSLPPRQLAGCRVLLASRLTPAGTAPGPLPHPVVLVEVQPAGQPVDVLAYRLATALDRAGVRASVEVIPAGRPLPGYHAAALREARPVPVGEPGPARTPFVAEARTPAGARSRGVDVATPPFGSPGIGGSPLGGLPSGDRPVPATDRPASTSAPAASAGAGPDEAQSDLPPDDLFGGGPHPLARSTEYGPRWERRAGFTPVPDAEPRPAIAPRAARRLSRSTTPAPDPVDVTPARGSVEPAAGRSSGLFDARTASTPVDGTRPGLFGRVTRDRDAAEPGTSDRDTAGGEASGGDIVDGATPGQGEPGRAGSRRAESRRAESHPATSSPAEAHRPTYDHAGSGRAEPPTATYDHAGSGRAESLPATSGHAAPHRAEPRRAESDHVVSGRDKNSEAGSGAADQMIFGRTSSERAGSGQAGSGEPGFAARSANGPVEGTRTWDISPGDAGAESTPSGAGGTEDSPLADAAAAHTPASPARRFTVAPAPSESAGPSSPEAAGGDRSGPRRSTPAPVRTRRGDDQPVLRPVAHPEHRSTVTPISRAFLAGSPAGRREDPQPDPAVTAEHPVVPGEERPAPTPVEDGQSPALAETPMFAAMQDPLSGPLRTPLLDPLLDPTATDAGPPARTGEPPGAEDGPREIDPDVPVTWSDDWATGAWAMATSALDGHAAEIGPGSTGHPTDDPLGPDIPGAGPHRTRPHRAGADRTGVDPMAPDGDQPAADQRSGDQPAADQRAADQPAGDQPAGDQPAGDRPAGDAPAGDMQHGTEPHGTEDPAVAGAEPEDNSPAGAVTDDTVTTGTVTAGDGGTPASAPSPSPSPTRARGDRDATLRPVWPTPGRRRAARHRVDDEPAADDPAASVEDPAARPAGSPTPDRPTVGDPSHTDGPLDDPLFGSTPRDSRLSRDPAPTAPPVTTPPVDLRTPGPPSPGPAAAGERESAAPERNAGPPPAGLPTSGPGPLLRPPSALDPGGSLPRRPPRPSGPPSAGPDGPPLLPRPAPRPVPRPDQHRSDQHRSDRYGPDQHWPERPRPDPPRPGTHGPETGNGPERTGPTRLSDADRALLARLQAELDATGSTAADRDDGVRNGSAGPNGTGPHRRGDPPDLAG